MRVLIVEDEPIVAFEIEAIVLDQLPGVETVLTGTVQGARDAVEHSIDIAILDVDVLDGTTYALALELRSLDVPFVFVSGVRSTEAPAGLSEASFIAKPFAPCELAAKFRAIAGVKPA